MSLPFIVHKIHYVVAEHSTQRQFIIVFTGISLCKNEGNKIRPDYLMDLYDKNPTDPIFLAIFSKEELKMLNKQNKQIDVYFSPYRIYRDDSIGIMKLKFIGTLLHYKLPDISFEELYFFYKTTEEITPSILYQQRSNQSKSTISNSLLQNILLNISVPDAKKELPKNKDDLSYDDILNIPLFSDNGNGFKYDMFQPLNLRSATKLPSYVANPFYVKSYDQNLERGRHLQSSHINNLVFEFNNIKDQTFYVCFARDVFHYANQNKLNDEFTTTNYFPLLNWKHIINLSKLDDEYVNGNLMKHTKNNISKLHESQTIDVFYDVYYSKQVSDVFSQQTNNTGITDFQIVFHQKNKTKIPLDVVFKLLGASSQYQMIKYHSTLHKQEKIYRFFVDGRNQNGRKIPFLNKSTIFKLDKIMAKKPSVSIYNVVTHSEKTYNFIYEWYSNGDVIISWVNESHQIINNYETIDALLVDGMKNMYSILTGFFGKNGYTLCTFKSLKDTFSSITHMSYSTTYNITSEFNIQKINACLASIFVVDSMKSKKFNVRYKRVSNFEAKNVQEALVINKINQGVSRTDIIHDLEDIHKLSESIAINVYDKVFADFELNNVVHHRKVQIQVNSGFPTTFELTNKGVTIQIHDINNFNYLEIIPIYIHALVQLTHDTSSHAVELESIERICHRKVKKDITFKTNSETKITTIEDPESSKYEQDYDEDVDDEDETDLFEDGNSKTNDFLDLIDGNFDFEDDSDSDDEMDGHSGGNGKKTEKHDDSTRTPQEKEVINTKLKHDNYFQTKIEQKVPQLFVTSDDKRYETYSRLCQSSSRSQPVILTKSEKDEILKTHKDDINVESDVIEYQYSENDEKYYYMCPQYWCLLTKTFISKKEILEGKCGKKVQNIDDAIIPKNAKVVPPGKYVYQFYENEKDKKYPGFHKKSTEYGKCVPCCYKIWDKSHHQKRRRECQQNKVQSDSNDSPTSSLSNNHDEERYIIGPEKYPIDPERWGFLPFGVQAFFQDVQVNINAQSILKNKSVNILLRRGIEHHSTQSFIGCIANIMFFLETDKKTGKNLLSNFIKGTKSTVPSIKEMKQIIKDSVSLDIFATLQNGNLIEVFKNPNINVNRREYQSTTLHENIGDDANQLVVQTTKAYNNFLNFLDDDDVIIDYKWLWDLIVTPNKKLFPNGINLVILELLNNDTTNNVSMICPTNVYSGYKYCSWKQTIIILQQENYYEPIYYYTRQSSKNISVIKMFNESSTLPNLISQTLKQVIKPVFEESCKPQKSSESYKFQTPPTCDKLIGELTKKKYSVMHQIMNFQGKIIGIFSTDENSNSGVIPCYPSSVSSKYPKLKITYMTNHDIWKSYEETLDFLKKFYNYQEPAGSDTNGKCKEGTDLCKVVDDQMIVGFLTVTNQFVQISDPIEISSVTDSLKSVDTQNYIVANNKISTQLNEDEDRIKFIRMIRLETEMYKSFRNTLRILLSDNANLQFRDEIFKTSTEKYVLYSKQLDDITKKIRKIMKDHVVFVKINPNEEILKELKQIITCNILSKNECANNSMCSYKDTTCVSLISAKNLVTGKDNNVIYFRRISDELIRYVHIRNFLLHPQTYLMLENVSYNIHENEIILFQHLLTQDFFIGLDPIYKSSYEGSYPYDIVYSSKINKHTHKFITKYSDDKKTEPDPETSVNNNDSKHSCTSSRNTRSITISYWRNKLPSQYEEVMYFGSYLCGFYFIKDIIRSYTGKNVSIQNIHNTLINQYKKYTDEFKNKQIIATIAKILLKDGHKDARNITNGTTDLESYLVQDSYFLTNFDIWALCSAYEIPSVMIIGKKIHITDKKEFAMFKPTTENKDWILIMSSIIDKSAKLSRYRYIQNNGTMHIEINNNDIQTAINDYIPISKYLEQYALTKRKKRVIVEDNDEDE